MPNLTAALGVAFWYLSREGGIRHLLGKRARLFGSDT